jgi:hypothetical protein
VCVCVCVSPTPSRTRCAPARSLSGLSCPPVSHSQILLVVFFLSHARCQSPRLDTTFLRTPPITNSYRCGKTHPDAGEDASPLSFGRVAVTGATPTTHTSLLRGVNAPPLLLSDHGGLGADEPSLLSGPISKSHLLSGMRDSSSSGASAHASLVPATTPLPSGSGSSAFFSRERTSAVGRETAGGEERDRESEISEFITYCNATPDLSTLVTDQPVGALFPELERFTQLLDSA